MKDHVKHLHFKITNIFNIEFIIVQLQVGNIAWMCLCVLVFFAQVISMNFMEKNKYKHTQRCDYLIQWKNDSEIK